MSRRRATRSAAAARATDAKLNLAGTTSIPAVHLTGSGATLGVEGLATSAARLEAILRAEDDQVSTAASIRTEMDAITHEFELLATAMTGPA